MRRTASRTIARIHTIERKLIVVEGNRRDHAIHVGCVYELVAFVFVVAAVDVILTQIVERLAEARFAVVYVKYVLFEELASHAFLIEHELARLLVAISSSDAIRHRRLNFNTYFTT